MVCVYSYHSDVMMFVIGKDKLVCGMYVCSDHGDGKYDMCMVCVCVCVVTMVCALV